MIQPLLVSPYMFLLVLKYKVSIEQVDRVAPAHREYLSRAYQAEELLVSGPRVPRTGGVIVARVKTRQEVDALIHQDPFFQQEIADYEVIEFLPASFHPAIAGLV
jgi:uncharacterized protein YciI